MAMERLGAKVEIDGGYVVARDGVEIASAPSVADAKLDVKREG